jgi:hypothetical protein
VLTKSSLEYQEVILELEELDHALKQLFKLKGAERETVRLDANSSPGNHLPKTIRGVSGEKCSILNGS